ncbi:DUF1905 domain-containing protein [Streptomyces tardus]|uniref:DUF1905 domain-containing protein n=1 Tax=Streptomyces tardus TaxID=2780544 RepID=UPI001F2B9374|nr:DUF1905 domain-containing protein [Streptomyces tardus]
MQDVEFVATFRKSAEPGGYTYLVRPESVGFFGTRGRVKVRGAVDAEPFDSAFSVLGDGRHKLPVRAGIRAAVGKKAGEAVTVRLHERLG